jgi:hypothetical protein
MYGSTQDSEFVVLSIECTCRSRNYRYLVRTVVLQLVVFTTGEFVQKTFLDDGNPYF